MFLMMKNLFKTMQLTCVVMMLMFGLVAYSEEDLAPGGSYVTVTKTVYDCVPLNVITTVVFTGLDGNIKVTGTLSSGAIIVPQITSTILADTSGGRTTSKPILGLERTSSDVNTYTTIHLTSTITKTSTETLTVPVSSNDDGLVIVTLTTTVYFDEVTLSTSVTQFTIEDPTRRTITSTLVLPTFGVTSSNTSTSVNKTMVATNGTTIRSFEPITATFGTPMQPEYLTYHFTNDSSSMYGAGTGLVGTGTGFTGTGFIGTDTTPTGAPIGTGNTTNPGEKPSIYSAESVSPTSNTTSEDATVVISTVTVIPVPGKTTASVVDGSVTSTVTLSSSVTLPYLTLLTFHRGPGRAPTPTFVAPHRGPGRAP